MSQLPIVSVIPQLLQHISDGCTQIILKAAPGAGKSTYFPLTLLKEESVSGRILLLEPRRLAVRNIAHYIAGQLGEKVGQSVGYRIRGETCVSDDTRLEIVTEGILTRMIQSDPELDGISMILFDEFHERSLHADTSLAFALEVQGSLRDDLQLVVMSATLDETSLTELLPQAMYVESEGRSFPVECHYAPARINERFESVVVRQILKSVKEETGSILVFLPGISVIKRVAGLMVDLDENTDVFLLHGQLDFRIQQQALVPSEPGRRKIVLTTNIAETSLTIEGVRIVIDAGLEKIPVFDVKTGITRLEQQRISRSSAVQRAGRAGRLEPGVCIRLYSESQYDQLQAVPEPEIKRSDLTSLAFELAQWGVRNPEELQWLDIPPHRSIIQAYELLMTLGLVDERFQITGRGRRAYSLGTEPRLAAMFTYAQDFDDDWVSSACAAVSLVEEPVRNECNLLSSLHSWKSGYHTKRSLLNKRARHFSRLTGRSFLLDQVDEDKVASLLAIAYPDRVGFVRDKPTQYVLSNGHGAEINAEDIFSRYIVVPLLTRHHSMDSRVDLAVNLNIKYLMEHLSFLVDNVEWVDWDDRQGKLVAEQRVCLGQLILDRKPLPTPDKQKMTEALLNYVRRTGLSILNWSNNDRMFIERVLCASLWLPDFSWPAMDDTSLMERLDEWLVPFMAGITSLKKLKTLSLAEALKSYVGWELCQILDKELPTLYELPTGSRKPIQYLKNHEPVLSVRIQEVFGMAHSPLIAMGTKALVFELLSPAQRPIQITQDLQAFWQGSYKEVQKEMKGRYPKHPWPDDPENHIATTKTKRQLNS
ncbi:ATP-dependent helicase HrpB [Vibrio salinus]|uniref:ATP-dependent helicase HrpB n=1 Tax=Vibrio salinus TaxID=2899784 RepID=UPI001E5808B3|nr:ATP-dependent helicase HrpB [Vibrio salinus]MCE0493349.1 ATP-dependent helicase HrpB [Vibrio salinus]